MHPKMHNYFWTRYVFVSVCQLFSSNYGLRNNKNIFIRNYIIQISKSNFSVVGSGQCSCYMFSTGATAK